MLASTTTMSHVPTDSPDTYMGGSEGVMQVADYGEILYETWLNSSYGSPHTNWGAGEYLIGQEGDVNYSSISVDDSYGSPGTLILYSDGMSYRSDGSGNIDTVNDGVMQFRNVTDSYGNKNS